MPKKRRTYKTSIWEEIWEYTKQQVTDTLRIVGIVALILYLIASLFVGMYQIAVYVLMSLF